MAFVLSSRSRSKAQGSVKTAPKQKSARVQHSPDSRFGFAKPVFQPHATALPTVPVIQAKLKVGESDDKFEEEADRVAGEVMRMPEPQLHRACACGGGCPQCQMQQPGHGHERLQTKRVQVSDTGQIAAPPIVHEVLAAPGQLLDPATRGFMESRFGHDFSRVRVHTGENAAASAKALGALAYAYGSDVTFGAGQYSPHTWEGRRLLAHELAHVVQQQSVIPENDTLADGNTTAEVEAGRAAAAAAHGDDIAVIRERAGAIQLQPTQPTLITIRPGNTERIEDPYGAGSLDETQWGNLLDSAEQALAKGQTEGAERAYLTLYSDIAKLAQATRVVSSSGVINVVTGSKTNCNNATPGLNLSLGSQGESGANATTAYVDDQGKFGVKLNRRGAPQPLVAIVLSRSAFKREKEQTLAALRHEMVHAEHYNEDAAKALLSDPKDKSSPDMTSAANTELLAYVEGFMTMFHLTHPAPTSSDHPAFVQLLGALDGGNRDVLPWAEADPSVKSEALGRLQEYYCHALDQTHREAFDAWVGYQLTVVRRDELITWERTGGNVIGAMLRVETLQGDFFRGLERVIASKCKGLALPLKL